MATAVNNGLPPLPEGFQLEGQQAPAMPAMPEGFQLEQAQPKAAAPAQAPSASPSWTDTAIDGAKQLGSGLAEGIEHLPTTVPDIGGALGRGAVWAANKIAPDNAFVKQVVGAKNALDAMTLSPDKDPSTISSALPAPQTPVGGPMRTVGGMLPAALGMPGNLAGNVVKQAVIPGVAMEGAGAAADAVAPEYAPAARVAAGMLTAKGSKGGKAATSEDFGKAATKNFNDFRQAPITLKPDMVSDRMKDAKNELNARGLQDTPANNLMSPLLVGSDTTPIAPTASTVMSSRAPAPEPTPVKLDRLQQLRSDAGDMAKRSDTPEGKAALIVKQHVDNLLDNLQGSDTVTGSNLLPKALADLKSGQANTATKYQLKAIESAQYRGEQNADTTGVGDNSDNAQRQRIKALLVNPRGMGSLEPYRRQMEAITNGSFGQNLARRAGSALGGGAGMREGWMLGGLMGSEHIGAVTGAAMLATPAVGAGLKKWASSITTNKINALKTTIASRTKGTGVPAPTAPQSPWMTRALIGAGSGR